MLLVVYLHEFVWANIVAITYTSLILAELINVAFEASAPSAVAGSHARVRQQIARWHRLMIVAEVVTVAMYATSLVVLRSTFDMSFVLTGTFVWKVGGTGGRRPIASLIDALRRPSSSLSAAVCRSMWASGRGGGFRHQRMRKLNCEML